MATAKIKLKEIKIKGFKSFSPEEGIDVSLGDISLLLGANGSGKSNFISFFKMLEPIFNAQFQNYIATSGSPDLFLHYGVKRTKEIEAQFHFDIGEQQYYIYHVKLAYAVPDKLIFVISDISLNKGKSMIMKSSLTTPEYEIVLEQIELPLYKILLTTKVYQFHDTGAESPLRMPSHIDNADYLQSNGANLAAFLYEMKRTAPNYYNRIVEYIRLIMPQFGDFYLEPNKGGYVMLKWKDNTANDYIQLPQQISDGTLRFMALATLLLQPAAQIPSIILLDEPELGLHPAAICQFAEMVKEASTNTQIIIATQSPQLADEFEPSQIIIAERDEEKSATILKSLDEKKLKDWLNEYSISELWHKNVIGGRP